jgi:hypothetical protein
MHSAVTRCHLYSNGRATPSISRKLLISINEFQEACNRRAVLNPTTCRHAVRKSKAPLSERRQQFGAAASCLPQRPENKRVDLYVIARESACETNLGPRRGWLIQK